MNRKLTVAILITVLMLINLFVLFFKPFAPSTQEMASSLFSVFYSLLAVIGAAIALAKLKIFDRTKRAWLFLFIGIILFFISESLYAFFSIFLKINLEAASPTITDPIYILAYFPIIIGLFIFVKGYFKSGLPLGDLRKMIPSGIIFIAGVALMIIKVLFPIWHDPGTSSLAKIVRLYYPIADMVILLLLLHMIYLTSLYRKGKYTTPWIMIGFGFASFTVSDILYAIISTNSGYQPGNIIDLGWNLAYLLFAASGIQLHTDEQANFIGQQEGHIPLADQIINIMAPGIGREMAEESVKLQCKNMKLTPESLKEEDLEKFAFWMSTAISIIIGTDRARLIQYRISKLKR